MTLIIIGGPQDLWPFGQIMWKGSHAPKCHRLVGIWKKLLSQAYQKSQADAAALSAVAKLISTAELIFRITSSFADYENWIQTAHYFIWKRELKGYQMFSCSLFIDQQMLQRSSK